MKKVMAMLWLAMASGHANAAECALLASGLGFGVYRAEGHVSNEMLGSIEVECRGAPGEAVSYRIELTQGYGRFSGRRMRSEHHEIGYNLFIDAARSVVWGDGSAGTGVIADGFVLLSGLPASRQYPVFGQVDGGQRPGVGVYTDSVMVNLHY